MGRSKVEKRYCYSCGNEVIVFDHIYAYNEKTGEPLTTEWVKCPNRRWYSFGHYVTESESYAMQA